MSDPTTARASNLARQKLCDAQDWAHPQFQQVIRSELGLTLRLHPRQWEAAAVLCALSDAAALHPAARGIAFGAGREPLLFAIARRVGHLVATDLYEPESAWGTARTADAQAFVMAAAPAGFPAQRLSVQRMDMRRLAFAEASFDFAYSVSAFEHIGEEADFLAHLREVRRVLRPAGLYVLTTEVALAEESRRSRGNWAFAPADLFDLFAAAGLQPEPLFDMRLAPWRENAPRPAPSLLHADPAETLMPAPLMRDLGGVLSLPALFLLRPAEGAVTAVQIEGFAEARLWAEAERQRLAQLRFSDWVQLNPFAQCPGRARVVLDLWANTPLAADPQPIFATPFILVGAGELEVQLTAMPSLRAESKGVVALRVMLRTASGEVREAHFTLLATETAAKAAVYRCRLSLAAGERVAFFGYLREGTLLLSSLTLAVRRCG